MHIGNFEDIAVDIVMTEYYRLVIVCCMKVVGKAEAAVSAVAEAEPTERHSCW